jgi:hypothetical protein
MFRNRLPWLHMPGSHQANPGAEDVQRCKRAIGWDGKCDGSLSRVDAWVVAAQVVDLRRAIRARREMGTTIAETSRQTRGHSFQSLLPPPQSPSRLRPESGIIKDLTCPGLPHVCSLPRARRLGSPFGSFRDLALTDKGPLSGRGDRGRLPERCQQSASRVNVSVRVGLA